MKMNKCVNSSHNNNNNIRKRTEDENRKTDKTNSRCQGYVNCPTSTHNKENKRKNIPNNNQKHIN